MLCDTDIGKNSNASQNPASEYASIIFASLSALFAAIITSLILFSLNDFNICSSNSVTLSYSISHIKRSLSLIAFSVLSTISFAISSVSLEKSSHPESDNTYVSPFSSSLYSYSEISLVVHSSSATIAIL
ncbi:hypothetical protein HOG21_04725 [bacterium]|nr:hypothetical protein [bacterium]